MQLTLRNFKNNSEHIPFNMFIPINPCLLVCPVHAMREYLSLFKNTSGPLFQFIDGSHVPYSFAADKLGVLVKYLGLNPRLYKPHSLRIGAATAAFMDGQSEDRIKKMGRWHSDALQRYIRIAQFKF